MENGGVVTMATNAEAR